MVVLIDTSFIIAYNNEKDVHHKKAKEIWPNVEDLSLGQYFISDYIFDEIIAVSLRKTDKNGTVQLGQKLLESMPVIAIDDHMFDEAWTLFKNTETTLNFTDCTNVTLLHTVGSSLLLTFDKGFKDIEEIKTIGYESPKDKP